MMVADLSPKSSIWLERRGALLIGDREARLLEGIARAGSLKEGAKAAATLAACGLALACGHRAPPPGPQSRGTAMFGRWEYVAPPLRPPARAPTLNAGLQVTLEIDSAAGPLFYGRVARWFAGDAGVSPEVFGPVTGTVGERLVQFTIAFVRAGASPIIVGASFAGADTLRIETASRGNDPGPFAPGSGGGGMFVRTRRGRATSKP